MNLNHANMVRYRGDLYAWRTFDVGQGAGTFDIDLWKVIRLRAPQDNDAPMPGWGADCPQMFITPAPVRVAWDAPAAGLSYEYVVERVECPYVSRGYVLDGRTDATHVELPLPASAPNEFYLLRLYGWRGDRRIAYITTHGTNGVGSDYRFRVR